MIRVIKTTRPRMFLFENVKGLKTGRWTDDGKKGEIWDDVLEAFNGIKGYTVRATLVQAKNYGVPQNRPRVLIAGIRNDVGWKPLTNSKDAVQAGLIPAGGVIPPDLIEVFGDLIDAKYDANFRTDTYPAPAKGPFQEDMRRPKGGGEPLGKGARVTEQEYSRHSPRIVEKFEYMRLNQGKMTEEMQTKKFAQRLLSPTWGNGGPNITATSLADDFVHWAQPRSLTVREWARLQCFPDWYQFKGPRTTGGVRRAGNPNEGIWDREVPKYTQIGNAVPVRLARAVGEHFKSLLEKSKKKKKK